MKSGMKPGMKRDMRRKEKEITDLSAIADIIGSCRVCRLGMADGDRPYVVPLNFGYAYPHIYFHSAAQGRKIDILKKNPRVCCEFDRMLKLNKNKEACSWGADFKSVIAEGTAEILSDRAEKEAGLARIMAQYSNREFEFPADKLEMTAVIRVTVETITGKASPAQDPGPADQPAGS